MIQIDEETYTACMFLLRQAQVSAPTKKCDGDPNWKSIERKLRIVMMHAMSVELRRAGVHYCDARPV